MKKYSILVLAVLLVFSMFLVVGCGDKPAPVQTPSEPGAASDYGPPSEVTTWVFQPVFDSSDAGWSRGVVPWIKAVEEATQGTVKFELLPVGSITSGGEAFAATMAGMIDVYAGWATYYGGDMPEGMLAYGLAMGADNQFEAWAAMWGDPKYRIGDIVQQAANERNLQWIGWTNQGPNAAFTKFPVYKLEDFAGRKMRAGAPQAIFLQAMGGAPVSMPGGEIYMSIRLGTIEGTFWDTGGMADMKFHEVTDYAIMPGWCPAQHQEIYVNLDKWNALNQWQRDRISEVFMSTYFETSRLHLENVETALQIFVDAGGEVITLSDEEVDRMRRKSVEEVWPKVAEASSGTAKGVELWKQFLIDIGKY
ncbi:TRAP transporter substrate-binding protein [Desulfitibacter alkalitolerans]|uniref:TRAP transporter substrate-binding protein n=1 Tax=Desulfitibacter alkalitolerans TaxID=264641 RepID=UPI0004807776|nr:TRAP transporter substrate-binding protein DctP [Desulfitibacter alkalitolerans]